MRVERQVRRRRRLSTVNPQLSTWREAQYWLLQERQKLLDGGGFLSVWLELEVLLEVLLGGGLLVLVEGDHSEKVVAHRELGLGGEGLRQSGLRVFHVPLVVGLDPLVVQDV